MEKSPNKAKGGDKGNKKEDVAQTDLDIAKQVLQESFAKDNQEEDPYTKMAKQIEEKKKHDLQKKSPVTPNTNAVKAKPQSVQA
jgi:hypothetical protein